MIEIDLNSVAIGAGLMGLFESFLIRSTRSRLKDITGVSRILLLAMALLLLAATIKGLLDGEFLLGVLVLALFFFRLYMLGISINKNKFQKHSPS